MTTRPALALGSITERMLPLGLNLVGATAAEAFDRTQPSGRRVRELATGCGTVVVVASGGREFWQRMQLDSGSIAGPTPRSPRPVDDRCAKASRDVAGWLATQGVVAHAVCPRRHPALNFSQLAEMAGLGVVSPVSDWLLNPHFGPWLSVRFALLIDGTPFGAAFPRSIAGEYQPCAGCDQPCVRACPANACCGGSMDRERCATSRHAGGCASGCEMKRACPQGVEHRFGADEEVFRQAEGLVHLRKEFGLGVWGFVPRDLRSLL